MYKLDEQFSLYNFIEPDLPQQVPLRQALRFLLKSWRRDFRIVSVEWIQGVLRVDFINFLKKRLDPIIVFHVMEHEETQFARCYES